MRHRAALKTAALGLAAVALTSCASQPQVSAALVGAPGFFSGIWHGIICPLAFLDSLLDSSVRMYAFPNTGVGYDFGFLIGLSAWGGGSAAGAGAIRR